MDFALLLDILPTDYDKAKDIAVWNQVVNYKYHKIVIQLMFCLFSCSYFVMLIACTLSNAYCMYIV